MEENRIGKPSEVIRICGYLIAGGALLGFTGGTSLLFNPELSSLFLEVSEFETLNYFLSVFTPSFVVLMIIGYVFIMVRRPKKSSLSNLAPLCLLSLVSLVLSALSIFYVLSFLGGLLSLVSLTKTLAKPSFRTVSDKEAFFLTELGALFVLSFSILFLFTVVLSGVLQTYVTSFQRNFVSFALVVGIISFFVFLSIPLLGSGGTKVAVGGTLGLMTFTLTYLLLVQNGFAFLNASSYLGAILASIGLISALGGALIYVKEYFFPTVPMTDLASLFLFQGKNCPYCGKPRETMAQTSCSNCGRSLMWTPYAPFCSSCGLLVPVGAQTCPHCKEDFVSKRTFFHKQFERDQATFDRVTTELKRQKSWAVKIPLLILLGLKKTIQVFQKAGRFLTGLNERLSLTLKDVVFIVILAYVLNFASFIAYVRVDIVKVLVVTTPRVNYGFPLEWLRTKIVSSVATIDWNALILDVLFYFLLATIIVTAIVKLRRRSH